MVTRLTLAVTGAGTASACRALLDRYPPGGPTRWRRRNYRGADVSLLAGPALVISATASAAAAPLFVEAALPSAWAAAVAAAGLGAGVAGLYDDMVGIREAERVAKGFRGHAAALTRGRVTAGSVKLVGIGAAGLLAGWALESGRPTPPGGRRVSSRAGDVALTAGLVAGVANLVNLLDLRPGRALKVSLAGIGALTATRAPAGLLLAGPLGAAVALLPDDLAESAMLGDAGANCLGALVGLAAAAAIGRCSQLLLLAGVAALTATSEVVSYSAAIDRIPALRRLDALGRRPVQAPVIAAAAPLRS